MDQPKTVVVPIEFLADLKMCLSNEAVLSNLSQQRILERVNAILKANEVQPNARHN